MEPAVRFLGDSFVLASVGVELMVPLLTFVCSDSQNPTSDAFGAWTAVIRLAFRAYAL